MQRSNSAIFEYGRITVILEYGRITAILEYGRITAVLEYGRITAILEYGRITAVLEYGRITAILEYGRITAILEYGRITAILEHGCITAIFEYGRITAILEYGRITAILELCILFKGYTNKDRHKCNRKCFDCKKVGISHRPRVIRDDDVIECGDCNRVFYTQECYDRHLEKVQPKSSGRGNKRKKIAIKSTCETFRRCRDCLKTIDTRKAKHLCGFYFCGRCGGKEKEGDEHHCYIQPITLKKKKKKSQEEEEEAGNPDDIDSLVREHERGERGLDCDDFELLQTLELLYNPAEEDDDDDDGDIRRLKAQLNALAAPPPGEDSSSTPTIPIQFDDEWCYIFWDFETRQDRQVGENQFAPIYAHDIVYAAAVKVCNTCVERVMAGEEGFCISCGENWYTFRRQAASRNSAIWLFDEKNAGVTAIAHNARGFDTHFLLQYLIAQGIKPITINRGREILLHDSQAAAKSR